MSYDAAQAHARRKADERAARVEELRAELRRLCRRLPATHQHWDAARIAAFKKAAAAGERAASDFRGTEPMLTEHLNTMRQFYE